MNIALVYNWPGSKNSELDLIGRINEILKVKGHTCYVIDPFGQLLDQSGTYIEPRDRVSEKKLDFVLNFHYSSPNFLDAFSYFTNWNPIDYLRKDPATRNIISHDQELHIANSMRSHNMALQAGSSMVDQYYQAINICNPVYEELKDLNFFTSCQYVANVNPVDLNNPRIFYIGINWERLASAQHGDARHGGLLEMLDDSGFTDFYGVARLRGRDLWEGFRNYHGELPFDNGQSIINKSNECGISLVLSSRSHHDSELISTRLFQACAARTVIIADDNPFLIKNFGDSIFSINFSDDAQSNFNQISEAYEWIKQNPEAARDKAEQSHTIFRNRFTLDQQLDNLLAFHSNHIIQKSEKITNKPTIQVIWVTRTQNTDEIIAFINNLNTQAGVNIDAFIVIASEAEADFKELLTKNAKFDYSLEPEAVMNKPLGHYLQSLLERITINQYFCIYSSGSDWLSSHLFTMGKAIHNHTSQIAQSGGCVKNKLWDSEYQISASVDSVGNYFSPVNVFDITKYNFEKYSSSSFLFKKEVITRRSIKVISQLENAHWFVFLVSSYLTSNQIPLLIPRITIRHLSDAKTIDPSRSAQEISINNLDKRLFRLCFDFRTASGEVFGLEKSLRNEMLNMVSITRFKQRIISRMDEKNNLLYSVLSPVIKLIIKYL